MTTSEAKRWVRDYFKHLDERQSDEIYTVIEDLAGCFDRLPKSLKEEYEGAETYHDLWLEVVTDLVIENDDPQAWRPQLYLIYIKDQAARGGPPPSKEGFVQWLGSMVDDDDVEQAMESWPPA